MTRPTAFALCAVASAKGPRRSSSRCSADHGRFSRLTVQVISVQNAAAVAAAAATLAVLSSPDIALAYGLTRDGRLEKCRGDEACVSTSSVSNPSKFGPPWTYEPQTNSAAEAWSALKVAVTTCKDSGTIVESRDGPKDFYLRAEFPSFAKGIDDVEFRLVPDDYLVTVRSCSREAVFIYPLQTPIDNGKNKSRLKDIRTILGWGELDGDIMSVASPEPQKAPDFLPDF